MNRILALLSSIVALLSVAPGQSGSAPKVFFIHCGTLIDGKSEQPRTNAWLEVRGDRIAYVCPSGNMSAARSNRRLSP